ncbi:MAG: cytochrome C biogenesis protein [Lachnospiraceae bacterium]|nr:cytochrome C biogenesis protein [Lachnospiraceae bacterium]
MNVNRIKLETYIPETHLQALRDALREAGAGKIGNYDSCMSYCRVTGTWRSLEGANPHIGEVGTISEEEEIKAEVVMDAECAAKTVDAVRRVHPYEEPVIHLIPLLDLEAL